MNTQKFIPDSMRRGIWSNHNNSRVILISILVVMIISAVVTILMYISIYALLIVVGIILGALVITACLNKPAWVLYFTLFVIFLPVGLIPDSLQSLLNRFMTVITLGIWLLSLVIFRGKIFWSGAATMMYGFVIWGILTLLWARNIDAAKIVLQVYALRFLLFLVVLPNVIRTLEKLNGLLSTMALSGWVFLIVSIVLLLQQGYTPGTRFKVLGVNENKAGLQALLMMVGILWVSFQYMKNRRALTSILARIFLMLTIVFISMSGSRGSAISLSITLLAFWFWRSTRPWGKLSLFILLIAIIIVPTLFLTTLERFTDFANMDDTLLGGREALWEAAWGVISKYPLEGVGIGGSPYAILSYLEVKPSNIGTDGISMHNPILTVWSETGIPGIILYLGILVSAIWSFVRQYFRYKKLDADEKFIPYFSLVASVFLGYMVSWIKGGAMQTDSTYFLLLALLVIPSGMDINETLGKAHPASPLEVNSPNFSSTRVLYSSIKTDNDE